MSEKLLETMLRELGEGMDLPKCHKCGCMRGALDTLEALPSGAIPDEGESWRNRLASWRSRLEPKRYECRGCEKCYPADALNALHSALPGLSVKEPDCGLGAERPDWPPIPGEYFCLCHGDSCSVAVSTLASPELAAALAGEAPPELCIVGKTETENIGIDKIIKNTITNPSIRYLIVAGREPKGHRSGQALLCLAAQGVDEGMRIMGSAARRPVLRNVTRTEVEAFLRQVRVVDMVGCEDVTSIMDKVRELGKASPEMKPGCGCSTPCDAPPEVDIPSVIRAQEPVQMKLDKAGYFLILPLRDRRVIRLEHYNYKNRLLHVAEGDTSRSLYWTAIRSGWVTELTHAAYLGKELARAESSLHDGRPFVQDGATGP